MYYQSIVIAKLVQDCHRQDPQLWQSDAGIKSIAESSLLHGESLIVLKPDRLFLFLDKKETKNQGQIMLPPTRPPPGPQFDRAPALFTLGREVGDEVIF